MRNAFALLLFVFPLFGQSTYTRIAGELFCGAVKRSSDSIQTYCYAPGNVLVFNTIATIHDRTILTYTRKRGEDPANLNDFDGIVWSFKKINDTEIDGDVTSCVLGVESALKTFQLILPLGATGPGCGLRLHCQWPAQFPCDTQDPPYYGWRAEDRQCLTSYSSGEWLDCCFVV